MAAEKNNYYAATVDYAVYSSVLTFGDTQQEARDKLEHYVNYYRQMDYPIRSAYIDYVCGLCQQTGRVHRATKRKHNLHSDKCYIVCPRCNGSPVTRVETMEVCGGKLSAEPNTPD